MLQTLHWIHCCSSIPFLYYPKLFTEAYKQYQMHPKGVGSINHFFQLIGFGVTNAAQYMISFHCYKSNYSLITILLVLQDIWDFLHKAAVYAVSSWLLHGALFFCVQGFAFNFAESEDIHVDLSLQPGKAPGMTLMPLIVSVAFLIGNTAWLPRLKAELHTRSSQFSYAGTPESIRNGFNVVQWEISIMHASSINCFVWSHYKSGLLLSTLSFLFYKNKGSMTILVFFFKRKLFDTVDAFYFLEIVLSLRICLRIR